MPALHDHAVSNIRYIRETMERASAFTSIPGWGGFSIGLTAAAAAGIAHPFAYARPYLWLTIWLCEALVATTIAAFTMWRKVKRSGLSFTAPVARRFFAAYGAPLFAGALLTFSIARIGALALLPATWLVLYGVSFISSGAFSISIVRIMGICFLILGIAAMFVDFGTGNILLAAGFGGLHVVFGYLIARSYGG